MERIRDTVINVMGALAQQKSVGSASDPSGVLKKTLTKKELAHIKVNYFRKGILGLSVDSSSWLYAFNLRKDELLAKLAKQIPLKDIRFNIGDSN